MRGRSAPVLAALVLGALLWSAAAARAGEETELFRRTLAQDIATAGFYELVAWLDQLGLSTQGDRRALADRLYSHYGVRAEEAARPGPEDPPLVIDSAARTSYFTLEEAGERYVRLSGGVVITLRDEETGALHRIEADEIVFNQDQRTISASGSVVYLLERSGRTERFTGAALTVALDDWEGGFVRGVTERERAIGGQKVDFSFSGTYITRSRDDVIVLEEGSITSSRADPPNYEIRARKIWVLAPGEWGLQGATLYVGRVPLFYLPFYFRPADRLFFNPSLGTRDRSGAYMQTTTYLAGSPPAGDAPFSLLQLAEDGEADVPRQRQGLFLVPMPVESRSPTTGGPGATIRLLADVYAKLGAYVALDAALASLGPLDRVEFYAGLAASRNIYRYAYPGQGTTYSPYYFTDGKPAQSWNTSAFGPLTLPLRYGLRLSSGYRTARGALALQFSVYSDHRFAIDFGDRSERVDWLGLLTGSAGPGSPQAQISSYAWQLSATHSFDTRALAPWVQSLRIQRAIVALNWRSRGVTAELPPEIAGADDSPQARFFYPDSLRLPEVALSVGGTLLQLPRPTPPAGPPPPADEPPLLPPWPRDESPPDQQAAEQGGSAGDAIAAPAMLPALSAAAVAAPFDARVGYSLAPSVLVDFDFADEQWQQPSDVDFSVAYGGVSARATGSVSYSGQLGGGVLRWDGTIASSGQYRTLFARGESVPDQQWAALEQQAWSFTSFNTTSALTLRALPLVRAAGFERSSVAYTTSLLLVRTLLDEVFESHPVYRTDWIAWNDDFFRTHQVEATAVYSGTGQPSLKVTAALPPRDQRLSAEASVAFAPGSLIVAGGLSEKAEEWTYLPLTSTLRIRPFQALLVTNALSYDVQERELTFNRSTVEAGPFSGRVELRATEGATFGGTGVGWVSDGERRLRPASAAALLKLSREIDAAWRGRVKAKLDVSLGANANLVRWTDCSLTGSLAGTLQVHEFLALSISGSSANTQPYAYIAPLARGVGRERRSFLADLIGSLNFASRQSRIDSPFNLQQLSLSAVHALGDWDLRVSYSGRPQIVTISDPPPARRVYEWRGVLDLNLQWRPIRELGSSIRADAESLVIRSVVSPLTQ